MQRTDLATGDKTQLYQSGDTVTGQVTLDLCGALFPSEDRRRARHQIGVVDHLGNSVAVSSEAVLYDSAQGAQQAITELRSAQANCPPGFVNGDVEGEPPLKYTFNPDPAATWPGTAGVTRFAIALTTTDQQGRAYNSVAIYQQRGELLVGFYMSEPAKNAGALAPSTRGIEGEAHAIARRLAALPASALAPDSNV